MNKKYIALILISLFSTTYLFYLMQINSNNGYNFFKNLEFGTDLNIIVSPHGIYTYKYLNFENLRECYNSQDFIDTAKNLNITVYWEGFNGSLFWFYFPDLNNVGYRIGLFYEVPIRWI